MKTFVISRDKEAFENANFDSTDILVEREGVNLVTHFQMYPERAIRIEFNPTNGLVKLEFKLLNGEFLAVGNEKIKP